MSENLTEKYFPESCFVLHDELIAKYPAEVPDACKLLVVEHDKNTSHKIFKDLAQVLKPGDTLVYNDSKVQARRIFLQREKDGKIHESLFLAPLDPDKKTWETMIYRSRKLKDGEILTSVKNPQIRFKIAHFESKTCLIGDISITSHQFDQLGEMPIPPYFNRRAEESDKTAYQNFFAANEELASAASPTASLHFTERLVSELKDRGICFLPVSLAIGYGTFAPLRDENFSEKKLHAEYYEMPLETAQALQSPKGRIICIGTTALRVTETVYRLTGGSYADHLKGFTDLFLFPPDKILSAQGLITNFHLPGSSLFLLTACLAGLGPLRAIYEEAMREQYRFYSYGDAMLILT